MVVFGNIETPTQKITLAPSFLDTKITIQQTKNFNIDGLFPFNANENSKIEMVRSNINSVQPLSQFSPLRNVVVRESIISPLLGTYQGDFDSLDFSNNQLNSEVGPSWCSTNLIVTNNQLTGSIPSCFKCYFNDTDNTNLPMMKQRFSGNQFTNFDTNEECTTFAPRPTIDGSTISITGNDIGLNPSNWYIEGVQCKSVITQPGKLYICGDLNNILDGRDFYSIRFRHPGNKTITFPIKQAAPIITSVEFGRPVVIVGQYFSSYNGYVDQVIKLDDANCVVSATEFNKTSCVATQTSSADKIPLEITVNKTLTTKILVSKNSLNNKQCPNGCINVPNGLCDMSTGYCMCQSNGKYQDCNTHVISSIDPSNTNGGEATFYGDFKNEHKGLTITIGDKQCSPITLTTSTVIKCEAPPGKGIQNVIMVQNDLTFVGSKMYKYKEIVASCPNNCTNQNQGTCNTVTGLCECINNYQSYDCSVKPNEGGETGNNGETIIDNETGSTNLTNSQTRFQIYFDLLKEVNVLGDTVKTHVLKDKWVLNNTDIKSNIFTFKQQLNGTNCSIISIIEEIQETNGKEFTFANTTFGLSKGSIKFTISINNYPYQSTLNSLVLDFVSTVDQLKSAECNERDTEIDTTHFNDISTFNYIKISRNNQALTGRFINKLISDGRPTFYSTSVNNDTSTPSSVILSLNLPHCDSCVIDPDFSLIVSPDFKECKSSRKWFIPVVVTVPIVGVACLIVIIAFLYRKSTTVKVIIKAAKLKKINK
ncbi:hypothetical protein DICPUDRAFT_32742 [Dictyostelium purpureum]|uniref:Uncharacterized protein n=1 Tax=Dictyostelium purpureum TaxID=5786 RepID=F0ZJL6_DICPU|nr:uncharacterized protein DICPUDRAFT_32742 [Dictyostelium purpureum]EGC35868.1 hypothetical protein DICPUDRAFT_32742 [Dictyostelium purpureum]|eukprot:XP_003287599.1 hypothetical protein DICPUDRAFT_32742 [Dictyostelium purpureum]